MCGQVPGDEGHEVSVRDVFGGKARKVEGSNLLRYCSGKLVQEVTCVGGSGGWLAME